jgi:hypothetical protein
MGLQLCVRSKVLPIEAKLVVDDVVAVRDLGCCFEFRIRSGSAEFERLMSRHSAMLLYVALGRALANGPPQASVLQLERSSGH